MDEMFLDDLRYAEEITLDAFRQRRWIVRVAKDTCNELERLL